MAADEKVLVIERAVFEKVGAFNGLAFNTDDYIKEIFATGVPQFMPRNQVEEDPSFKQLIPYVIMSCEGQYLNYVRGKRAGETRLVGNRSIGIGGHINPVDDMPLFGDFYDTYLSAVAREVAEEVNVETDHADQIVALLNDESNAVGSVHLGIVHYWQLDAPKVSRREQMITQMDFTPLDELRALRDTMETWSQLCLDGLEQMSAATAKQDG